MPRFRSPTDRGIFLCAAVCAMKIAVCVCRRTGACHVQKARSRLRKIRHIFPFKINCGRSAAVCKKPFKDCSKTVHKFACTIRYTMIVGRENTLPPANSFLHLVFFLSPFLFTLFFILHWYASCFPPLRKQGASHFPGRPARRQQIFHRPFKNCSYIGRANGVY